jgi:hypothetical protein
VSSSPFVVIADHLGSYSGRAVDVDAKGGQLEVMLDRLPVDALVVDRGNGIDRRHHVAAHA